VRPAVVLCDEASDFAFIGVNATLRGNETARLDAALRSLAQLPRIRPSLGLVVAEEVLRSEEEALARARRPRQSEGRSKLPSRCERVVDCQVHASTRMELGRGCNPFEQRRLARAVLPHEERDAGVHVELGQRADLRHREGVWRSLGRTDLHGQAEQVRHRETESIVAGRNAAYPASVSPSAAAAVADVPMVTLLLPGLDGTGRLFARLQPLLDPALGPRVVSFPPNRALGYNGLLAEMEVPNGPFAIVAESFSGPLGVFLASKYAKQVRALVLVASFVRNPSPLARIGAALGPRLFRAPSPDLALRWALLGMDATDADVSDVRDAVESVDPAVLTHRLRELARVDVTREFRSSSVPTLYLAGSRDRLVSPSVMRQLRRLRPDLLTRVLDAPHLVLQRSPAEAASLIDEFLLPRGT
jgi:pimeloyl-[acyl-carrier protein] methyl ester esterase